MEIFWAAVLLVSTAWTYTAVGAILFEHPSAGSARTGAILGWIGVVGGAALGLVPANRGVAPGIAAVTVVGIAGHGLLMFLDVPDDPRPSA